MAVVTERSVQAAPYAETAFMLARRSGDIDGWANALARLAAVVTETRGPDGAPGMAHGVTQDSAGLLTAYSAAGGLPLATEQARFVSLLQHRSCIDLLPEIQTQFQELFRSLRSNPPSTSTTHDQEGEGDATQSADGLSFDFDIIDLDAPEIKTPTVADVRAELEKIPHLTEKIVRAWGTTELDSFLNHLVMDSRDGSRKGLPMETAAEIMLLLDINKLVRAIDFARANNLSFAEAQAAIDAGDAERRKGDVWEDPTVASGIVTRRTDDDAKAGDSRGSGRSNQEGGQLAAAIGLLISFVTNKWVIGIVALVLTAKFFFRK